METVLLVIHTIIAIAMIGFILIQRSDNDGLGLGGGGGGSLGGLVSSRAAANFLTRTTAILATLFLLTSLALVMLTTSDRSNPVSIIDQIEVPATGEAVAPAVPTEGEAAPAATAAPSEGSQLRQSIPAEETRTPAAEAPAEETPPASAPDTNKTAPTVPIPE